MDPDAEATATASRFAQATLVAVALSTCQFNSTHFDHPPAPLLVHHPTDTSQQVQAKPVKKKKKTIYLTFDDGPNKGTRNVMRIIATEQVPVTFFVIGEQVYGSSAQAAIFDSLVHCRFVSIANHSFTHAHNHFDRFYTVPDSVVQDFVRCADSLQLTANIIRTPGRNIWRTAELCATDLKASKAAADSLYNHGFKAIGWDLEWHFNSTLALMDTKETMLKQVDSLFAQGKTKMPDCLVLLAHDQVYADAADSASLHGFIQQLKQKNEYEFETINRYPLGGNR